MVLVMIDAALSAVEVFWLNDDNDEEPYEDLMIN